MAQNIAVGIDVGTHQVKVVVAEYSRESGNAALRVIGAGFAASRGLRHGYIINGHDAAKSIGKAVAQAEASTHRRIKRAFLAIGGVGVEELRSKGETVVGQASGEITNLDCAAALASAEERVAQKLQNRKIIHSIPLSYKVDGSDVLGRPEGMKGMKLETDVLFITCLEAHLDDLIAAIEDAGVEVIDAMAAPIAAGLVTLSKAQKIAGCVLANIGAETVSIVVFENNIPISLKIFPIGSTDITNDIALGLRVSLEEADELKRGSIQGLPVPKKKLDDIVSARLGDILELIDAHLSKIGKSGLLPAGIVLSGGGSGVTTIEDLARAVLKLPSKVAALSVADLPRENIKDSTWAVAYGLCLFGFTSERGGFSGGIVTRTGGTIHNWIKQFLP